MPSLSFLCEITKCDGTLCNLGAVTLEPANSRTFEYGTELTTTETILPFLVLTCASPFYSL